MSALKELRRGEVGSDFIDLLRRTVLAVGIARNFPPPAGGNSWTEDDVDETTNAFLADGQTRRRLTDLALHCGTDQALAHRLQGSIRNFLRDQGRRTELGRLIRRVKRALREEEAFAWHTDGRWHLLAGSRQPSAAHPADLERAAAREDVVVPAWGEEARRAAPYADRESLVRLISAVLEAAEGSLTAAEIAKALAARLAVPAQPLSREIDAGDRPEPVRLDAAFDMTSQEVIRLVTASEILETLTDRERLALAHLELGVRELGPKIGVSHSQAHVIRQRAIDKLRSELVGEEFGEAVAKTVLELAKSWADDRTRTAGLP